MDILEALVTFLTPVATAAGGVWYGKRKTNAEAATSEMENVEKALIIYRGIISDLDEKVKRLEESLNRLQKRLSEVEEENYNLKRSRNENH